MKYDYNDIKLLLEIGYENSKTLGQVSERYMCKAKQVLPEKM